MVCLRSVCVCDVCVYACAHTPIYRNDREHMQQKKKNISSPILFLGLSVQPFLNISTILEVTCSGEALDTSEDLAAMALFTAQDKHVLATVNPWKNECTTSSSFSACVTVKDDVHKTKLRTLVLDLREEESRSYGCNVTTFQSAARTNTLTWGLTVKGVSK